jgi:3-deoxy-D-manno-octulosonic-acid transferase
MLFLYQLLAPIFPLLVRLAAFFNPKAAQWHDGRKGIFKRLEKENFGNGETVWIHCASLGEFEQGRPLMEAIKHHTDWKVLLTFFSPSGYEIRKNYDKADWVYYLPADGAANAQRFVQLVRPKFAVFVKYEFWYCYWGALQGQQVPLYLIAALFRPNQLFFKSYGKAFLGILKKTQGIFVQNNASLELLNQYGVEPAYLAGDTRVDRVAQLAKSTPKLPIVAAFVGTDKAIVCGSTWPKDELLLLPYANADQSHKYIIAPHDISEGHIESILSKLSAPYIRYSQATPENVAAARILVIDNIGLLSAIYQYGFMAYIGGGFGKGIHNTLEPIAFGLPVVFGPKYGKFEEAKWLVQNGGGFSIENQAALDTVITQLDDAENWRTASAAALRYIEANEGATDIVWAHLSKKHAVY